MTTRPSIAFVGMTHLGIVHAAAAAAKGFDVVAFDQDAQRVADLVAGRLPVLEPDLPELLAAHAARLRFTSDPSDLETVPLCYVAPDVATDAQGRSDLTILLELIALAERDLTSEAVLVVLSQVPPGFTRGLSHPVAKRFYQVETLIFGRAVERALQPERFILGCADPAAPLPSVLADFLAAFGCPLLPMGWESAELSKIAINLFLVSSISTTNMVADLCERIGADWGEIAPALRLDRRIGPHAYLTPGLGIAGGNLERDLAGFRRLAGETGAGAASIDVWIRDAARRRDWALRILHEHVFRDDPGGRLAVLGLAYKENTRSTRNSPALALLNALGGKEVAVWDPEVPADAVARPGLRGAADALDACEGACALVIMTPWPEFRRLDPMRIAERLGGGR